MGSQYVSFLENNYSGYLLKKLTLTNGVVHEPDYPTPILQYKQPSANAVEKIGMDQTKVTLFLQGVVRTYA